MSLPILNQPYAIDFHPTDFWGFIKTPAAIFQLKQNQGVSSTTMKH